MQQRIDLGINPGERAVAVFREYDGSNTSPPLDNEYCELIAVEEPRQIVAAMGVACDNLDLLVSKYAAQGNEISLHQRGMWNAAKGLLSHSPQSRVSIEYYKRAQELLFEPLPEGATPNWLSSVLTMTLERSLKLHDAYHGRGQISFGDRHREMEGVQSRVHESIQSIIEPGFRAIEALNGLPAYRTAVLDQVIGKIHLAIKQDAPDVGVEESVRVTSQLFPVFLSRMSDRSQREFMLEQFELALDEILTLTDGAGFSVKEDVTHLLERMRYLDAPEAEHLCLAGDILRRSAPFNPALNYLVREVVIPELCTRRADEIDGWDEPEQQLATVRGQRMIGIAKAISAARMIAQQRERRDIHTDEAYLERRQSELDSLRRLDGALGIYLRKAS